MRRRARGEDAALKQAIASPARTPAFAARDSARKPYEVLHFFELRPDAAVVEISPGAGYWTEILAPYLKPRGTYYAAQYPQDGGGRAYYQEYYRNFRAKLDADPARYDRVRVTAFGKGRYDIAPPGSADIVLTFRNLHNWMNDGYAEDVMAAFYRALKPGGILGIEAHRGRTDKPQDPRAADGYVRQDYAIRLAQPRASSSPAVRRRWPIPVIPRIIRRASGRCPRPSGWATRTANATPRSGRPTGSC